MKKIFSLLLLILLLAGCAKPAPKWIDLGYKQMETFKQDFLTGQTQSITESHFRSSVEELKKGGDIDLLGKVWLTRMALQIAVLAQTVDAGEYPKIEAAQAVPANRAYHRFLQGEKADVALLPAPYRSFSTELQGANPAKVAAAIAAIDDPLSRLIASGLAVRKGLATETILVNAADNASQNGWKRALIAWLEQLKSFYEASGAKDKAALAAARINLIK